MRVLKWAVGFMLGVALLPVIPFVAAAALAGFFAGEEEPEHSCCPSTARTSETEGEE